MVWIYVLLGFVQGVLEWLPVSSEGQIVLITLFFTDFSEGDALSLAFWMHLGTMFSVLYIYRNQWKTILNARKNDPHQIRKFLILTTLGTAVVGIPIKLLLEDLFTNSAITLIAMWLIAISLLVTSYLIHSASKAQEVEFLSELSELSNSRQFLIGCGQGLAIVPGISRSGTTISALLLSKVKAERAFEGSFLMSVPASLGSVVLDLGFALIRDEPLLGNLDPIGIVIAIFIAFIVGILSMRILLRVARTYNFAIITLVFGLVIVFGLLIASIK